MPVLFFGTKFTYVTKLGNDAFGQPKLSSAKQGKCAVLKMLITRQASTVRADSASTRGHAEELVSDLHILVPKTSVLKIDDVLTIDGVKFRVSGLRPRYDVIGRLDHIEVMGGAHNG